MTELPKFSKHEIVQYVIENLESGIHAAERAYQTSHTDAIEAEGKMQSRYDTMGIEAAYLAAGISAKIPEMQKQLIQLRNLDLPESNDVMESVDVGSLVRLLDLESFEREWYILLPAAGGEKIQYKGIEITALSPSAPLCEQIMGKGMGQNVDIGAQKAHGPSEKREVMIEYIG